MRDYLISYRDAGYKEIVWTVPGGDDPQVCQEKALRANEGIGLASLRKA
jgi:hypothetical protein